MRADCPRGKQILPTAEPNNHKRKGKKEEMQAFLGILSYMEIVKLPKKGDHVMIEE